MTAGEIENKLIEGIAAIMGKDSSAVKTDVPFHTLGIDSLSFVELLVFVEKAFAIQLIGTDLTKKDFETVQALASFISKNLP